ncbi:mitochondrial fission ELM1 family protein [Candidatus Kirkpatrickella diaphorinae]|uniref:Mitochondrial fission ELM1 family protein n=1 Tax=Candidatus Kirkpatrickella diaphorinae TaxID=2984322 RepID=A0ABY6GKU7_9PROT|nr:ELM1/GtrOC1 family putative glycosyltransferase [Candidatus Kirkpatrickella diaphorinae]UYH51271.1 mitochondrial fission ELM1 family protein [Candidatus Kirkpatrickella diaphorinae]
MIAIIDTEREGERTQCEALARALAMPFEVIAPWTTPSATPDIILSFGKALKPGLALHRRFERKPLLIQLGRPRLYPTSRLDLVIIMPQDDYPEADNVLHLKLPLNGASLQPNPRLKSATRPAQKGKTTLILSGKTAHHALGRRECDEMLRLAKIVAHHAGEALQVIFSCRTPPDIATYMQDQCRRDGITIARRRVRDVLAESARVIVTADSASLLADLIRSGLPTWLYPLPVRRTLNHFLKTTSCALFPRWRRNLIKKGLIAGGTDFARWHRSLTQSGIVRVLNEATAKDALWENTRPFADDDLEICVDRIRTLLAQRFTRDGQQAETPFHAEEAEFERLREVVY